ncbi:hypothetical protein [Leifsonia shinshuensis]|uniref:Lipoprotein n=1 Tax=Leifsonia shinshuensis TaxID=150026 RepID=A0A853CZA6_9MICO|nr:hypothetical protein [Leifsonia shinshuensis]NYJ23845.1 hypothetical protein [Leifsonia shinshuensis]
MRRRRTRATASGGVVLAAALALSGCVLDACPAIGYQDTSPVTLRFEKTLPRDARVAACFGTECAPADLPASADGGYRVPQQAPFLDDAVLLPTTVRVVVTAAEVLHDAVHEIPTRSERTGLWGQCPGRWWYEPVVIRWDVAGA